jgi:hypothetical protein
VEPAEYTEFLKDLYFKVFGDLEVTVEAWTPAEDAALDAIILDADEPVDWKGVSNKVPATERASRQDEGGFGALQRGRVDRRSAIP